jgi:hypothetical protein
MSDLPLVLDLFSGTGSATQPFVECGRHRVARIDIAGKPDIRADVRALPLPRDVDVEFVWASPPCWDFSRTGAMSRKRWGLAPLNPDRGVALVRKAREAIEWLNPRAWLIENVLDSLPYLIPELGKPLARRSAWVLWGSLPNLLPATPRMRKGLRKNATESYSELGRPTQRRSARIPRPLAEAVHRAVCSQGEEKSDA